MKKNFSLCIWFTLLLILSCQKEDSITNNYYSNDGIDYNPTVKPKLVHSNPGDGSLVPEIDGDLYINSSTINIFLSFTKAMNLNTFNTKGVSILGPNGKINFYVYSYGGNGNIINLRLDAKYFANSFYEVSLDTTVQDIYGKSLDKLYKIKFKYNSDFQVISSYVQKYDEFIPVYGVKYFYLYSNSKIDSSFTSNLEIDPQISVEAYSYDNYLTNIYFSTTDNLLFDTEYKIKVKDGAKDSFGNKMAKEYNFSFKTSPFSFKYSYSSGNSIYGLGYLTYKDVAFHTNGRVDIEDLKEHFEITPALTYTITKGSNDYIDYILVSLNAEEQTPNTEYTFTFKKGIKEKSGITLKEDYYKKLKTGIKK